jgi:hypothetical protein
MTVTPTTGEVAASYQRQVMALYYAYGRLDHHNSLPPENRVLVRLPDPIKFGEWYLAQWADFTNGECSFMPSVQDAWDIYRRSLAS